MNKPKIAIIGLKGLPAFGGAATVGENIIHQLKINYDFYVYSIASHTNEKGEMDGYYQHVFNKFPVKKLNVFFYYIKSAFHCLFLKKFDLIHLHHVDGAFILPFLRLKYKVICTSHARPQVNEKWPAYVKMFFTINERIALFFASEMTAVAKSLAEQYKSITKNRVHYIPNGINLNQSVANISEPEDPYMLFAAGRIIPLKGLHVLLGSLSKVKNPIKLKIIGDLDQLPAYKEKILSLSQDYNVEYIDIIKEKAKLLAYVQNARLFIFPSYSENMSIMLLEAAFVKTPVICSDIVQNKDIFSENEVLFFETNNESDLAAKIEWASNNMDNMKKLSDSAFQKLSDSFTWPIIANQYAGLFNKYL